MKKYLKCPYCDTELELSIGYDGCDWNSAAGEGSGFGHIVSLECPNDGYIFPLLRVKESCDVSRESDETIGCRPGNF